MRSYRNYQLALAFDSLFVFLLVDFYWDSLRFAYKNLDFVGRFFGLDFYTQVSSQVFFYADFLLFDFCWFYEFVAFVDS